MFNYFHCYLNIAQVVCIRFLVHLSKHSHIFIYYVHIVHAHILTEFLYQHKAFHVTLTQCRLWNKIDSFVTCFSHSTSIYSYILIAHISFCGRNCHIYNFDRSSWQFDQAPCPDWILPGQGLSSNLTHICFPLVNINLPFLE